MITDTLGRDIRLGYDRAGRLATLTDFTGRRFPTATANDGDLASVHLPGCHGHSDRQRLPGRRNGHIHLLGAAPADRHHRSSRRTAAGHRIRPGLRPRAGQRAAVGRSGNPTHFTYHPADEGLGRRARNHQRRQRQRPRSALRQVGACVGTRDYTARADAARPTTLTENRPSPPGTYDEPPFYETRYHYDNPDGLLTRIVRPDGSTIEKEFEIDLRPDASPIERGNLRAIAKPGPSRAATAGVGAPLRLSARASAAPAGRRLSPGRPMRAAACGRPVRRPGKPSPGRRPGRRHGRRLPTTLSVMSSTRTSCRAKARRDAFEYSDRHGQLVTETLDVGGLAITTAYEYDELGRLVLLRDPAGHEHRHVWNAWDLMVRRLLPDGTGSRLSTEDISYDANRRAVGRVVREPGREVIEARTYDVLGRLRTVSRESERGRRGLTAYDYDGNGNRVAARRAPRTSRDSPSTRLTARCGESAVSAEKVCARRPSTTTRVATRCG